MTPLLLVQVDSTDNSEKEAVTWLTDLEFTKKQIMVHTAKEPDPLLNSVQGDNEVEVLVFKMAVALGFDAPRAFCLVSFRSSRDADFGLQIVGRLMRVDRRIQRILPVARELMHGYVFLSDRDSQEGILSAGDRINAIRNELASLETSVDVIALSQNNAGVVRVENGKPELPGTEFSLTGETFTHSTDTSGRERTYADRPLFANWGFSDDSAHIDPTRAPAGNPKQNRTDTNHVSEFIYELKADVPKSFTKAEVDVFSVDILQDILNRFRWDAAELDRRAQLCLNTADADGFLDKRTLYAGLMSRLAKEANDMGVAGLESREELEDGLAHILALRPDILPKAISEAFAAHTVSVSAADLPAVLESVEPLAGSRFNLYGVYPADLNEWEREFAERLDNDLSGTILWWHRNPVRKSHSVCLPVAGHGFFFPDFIVGVKGRTKGKGKILVEIKYQINDPVGNAAAKSRAKHPDYGNVLMLYLNKKTGEWMTVEYDERKEQNTLDRIFREDLLVTY